MASSRPRSREKVAKLELDAEGPSRTKFLARLTGELSKRSVVEVLRKGVSDGPVTLDLFCGTPTPPTTRVSRGTSRTGWHDGTMLGRWLQWERRTSSMSYSRERALALLRAGTGLANAAFRDDQDAAIRHVVEGHGRLLVIQRTGWGKSSVYFIATKLLREAGFGPALLVSPLLALMRNQIEAAGRMGVRAATINSDNTADWEGIEERIAGDQVDILLISPERLANERFGHQVLASIAGRVSLLVIDEAHCISDWGHDFRPQYRLISRTLRALPPNLRVLATTATANNRVMDDLAQVLGPDITVLRGDLHRPSLTLQTISLPGQAERLAWLAEQLPLLTGSGIIYTLTIRDAHLVSDFLRSRGLNVQPYTGQLDEPHRVDREQALLENRVKALVATTALGMGYDKPDLAFVIHYQMPGSVVAYYQQVGRAGRRLENAYGVLLSGVEETEINDFFIESAFPTKAHVDQILAALAGSPAGLSVPELLAVVNARKGEIERAIQLLALESPSPIVKDGVKWTLTAAELSEQFWTRAARLTELRRTEQKQMREYVELTGGHMQFLVAALDGDVSGIGPPRLPALPTTVQPETVQAALQFLRRTDVPIEPRRLWVSSGFPVFGLRGKILENHRAQIGRALCMWGDAGWGELVRNGKHDGHFSDELVIACRDLVARWRPMPPPAWVTCIPSRRHARLVPDFARRLAESLRLPFYSALVKTDDRPAQKTMANSAMQARNVDGAFLLVDGVTLPSAPVLLVDDMTDSRWTLTVAAWLLRAGGAGEVWPLVLAQAGGGD